MLTAYTQFSSKYYYRWLAIETNNNKMQQKQKRLKETQTISHYQLQYTLINIQASAYEKQGRATITRLVTKFKA